MITTETQKGHNYLHCTRKKEPCFEPFVREEEVSKQVSDLLARVTLPVSWVDEMLGELTNDSTAQAAERASHLAAVRRKLTHVDNKFTRLTEAYVEEALSLEEYRPAKGKLIDEISPCRRN